MHGDKADKLAVLEGSWKDVIDLAVRENWDEEELLEALNGIRSEMKNEGVLPEKRYDTYEMNKTIFSIRSYLHERASHLNSSSQSGRAEELLNQSDDLLKFLVDIHRIVNLQTVQYPDFEDKEIKQELYKLFDRSKAKEQRKELRMRIMIRLVELCCPDKAEKEQKQFAQKEFVERGHWNVRHKGKLWKELKKFWQDSDSLEFDVFALDGRSEVAVTDPEEVVQALWDELDEKQRQDRKLQ